MEDHKHTAEQACLAEGLARRRPCSYRAGWSEAVGKTLELGQGTGQTDCRDYSLTRPGVFGIGLETLSVHKTSCSYAKQVRSDRSARQIRIIELLQQPQDSAWGRGEVGAADVTNTRAYGAVYGEISSRCERACSLTDGFCGTLCLIRAELHHVQVAAHGCLQALGATEQGCHTG